ncbi:hypothetical protein JCM30394_12570 [Deferrisoma palaeochoriense]
MPPRSSGAANRGASLPGCGRLDTPNNAHEGPASSSKHTRAPRIRHPGLRGKGPLKRPTPTLVSRNRFLHLCSRIPTIL